MTDLVARLRAEAEDANSNSDEANTLMCEAADALAEQAETIERLRAEILAARHGGRLPEAFWLTTP